jgi:RNA polymerase sigma-70 factor (ECF subfamily)
MLLGGISCVALAIVGGVFTLRESPLQSGVVPAAVTSAPAAPPREASEARETSETPPASREDGDGTPAVPSMSAHALPSAAVVAKQKPEKKLPAIGPSMRGEPERPSDDTLDREARLLANARRLRNSGDDTRALASLDEHAREFPHGLLESERMAERVAVLCNLGRKDEAVREAAQFLARHPKGALTRRVEMSCAGEAMKGRSP